MKISLAWLKRYLDLDHSPEVLEAQLNQLGFEVEGVVSTGIAPLDKVVVGEVLSKEPHPNANRLNICQVKTVEEGEPHRIVCGATNYKASGQHQRRRRPSRTRTLRTLRLQCQSLTGSPNANSSPSRSSSAPSTSIARSIRVSGCSGASTGRTLFAVL